MFALWPFWLKVAKCCWGHIAVALIHEGGCGSCLSVTHPPPSCLQGFSCLAPVPANILAQVPHPKLVVDSLYGKEIICVVFFYVLPSQLMA